MTVLEKYIIVYTYLLFVMGIAFAVSRRFKNNEASRNIIHICAGLGWLIYRILFPATIHPVIISGSFVILTIVTTNMKIRFIERENGSLGTIYFTSSMLLMSLLGYGSLFRFDIFGVATICLSCGDASANIIGSRYGTRNIYKQKSIQGTIACFCASLLAMMLLKYGFDIKLSFFAIVLLSALCAITELFAGDYDNIAIPAVLYITTYIILTNEDPLHFFLSLAIGVFMLGFAVKLKLLNIAASYILFFFAFVLYYFGGIKCYISLMLVFCIVIVVEKLLHKKTYVIFQSMNKEYGVRNERQLIANALMIVVSIAAYGVTKNEIFIITFFATIAETIGDSVASEIGVLSRSDPFDICTFKKVPKGVSGGISILGTTASVCVCLYTGLLYCCMYEMKFRHFCVIVFSSLLGILLDSVLGSKMQAQYRCTICKKVTEKERHCEQATTLEKGFRILDNTRVNLICNFFSFVLACLIMKG